jgi:hypothetical protein
MGNRVSICQTGKLTLEPVNLLLELLDGPLGEFGAGLSLNKEKKKKI